MLQKGTTISGTVELKDDSITIYNKIDGIDYEKKLSLNDIKSIEILEWNPYISSNSTDKSSQEIEYTFYPSKYKIKLNDGTVYYQKTRFKNLDVLSLETKYGKTIIYFIFVDYWVVKSKNEGIWSNSGLTDFDANNKNPNPLTAIRLDVIKNITKDEKN